MNEEWAKDKEQREKRLDGIGKMLAKEKEKTPPQWYVNGQGQTMVVIPGPVEFLMGSPLTEKDRAGSETQHKKRIGRTFALAAKSVTKEQFLRFQPKYIELACGSAGQWMMRYPEPTCPIGGFEWYEAAAYCNWLSKEEGIPEDQWCYEIKGNAVTLKAKYLSLIGVSLADGSGDGICDSCRCVDEPVLRGDGRVAAEVCVVLEELARTDVAGGEPEAERSWVVRRAGKRVHVVSGEVQRVSRRQGRWSGRGPRR